MKYYGDAEITGKATVDNGAELNGDIIFRNGEVNFSEYGFNSPGENTIGSLIVEGSIETEHTKTVRSDRE